MRPAPDREPQRLDSDSRHRRRAGGGAGRLGRFRSLGRGEPTPLCFQRSGVGSDRSWLHGRRLGTEGGSLLVVQTRFRRRRVRHAWDQVHDREAASLGTGPFTGEPRGCSPVNGELSGATDRPPRSDSGSLCGCHTRWFDRGGARNRAEESSDARRTAAQRSHPIPSRSASNRCGSGDRTVKRWYGTSPQSRSGGRGGIQMSG